ncbi:unnamed protein product [Rhizoctonia solani]|uniref:Uncharacterized protein n=1 Tax=Rhizoctonia solani TaxID=456999 RepID=A0A8H3CSY5_9AGAM|nr:unnamed protein product [Rhizoctonia solani]
MASRGDNRPHNRVVEFIRPLLTTTLFECSLQVLLLTAWATCISLICDKVRDLSIETTLLTVFGTILGFIISFRTSSAFERYNEGKRLLSNITYASRKFARTIWFHDLTKVPEGGSKPDSGAIPDSGSGSGGKSRPQSDDSMLEEKRTVIHLIEVFSIAVKRHLWKRGHKQEYMSWPGGPVPPSDRRPEASRVPSWGSGSTAYSTQAAVPDSFPPKKPARNVPLDVSCCLNAYIVGLQKRGVNTQTTTALLAALDSLVESFTDLEKVSNDQLPYSYRSQLWGCTYLYLFFLPFQLWRPLKYVTIPGTALAALIFLGLLSAGGEIENPVDDDRNDLNLHEFCKELRQDLEALTNPNPIVSTPDPANWTSSDKQNSIFLYLERDKEDQKYFENGRTKFVAWATGVGRRINFRNKPERGDEELGGQVGNNKQDE